MNGIVTFESFARGGGGWGIVVLRGTVAEAPMLLWR